MQKNSKPFHCTAEPNQPHAGLGETSNQNAEMELAKQVVFLAQQNFPIKYKHETAFIEDRKDREKYSHIQRRKPNWVFHRGKLIYHTRIETGNSDNCSSRLPDVIGCEDFGTHGITTKGCCTIKPLPTQLQNANENLVDEIVGSERQGIFPKANDFTSNMCDALPVRYTGLHCPNAIHGFEAVPLKKN